MIASDWSGAVGEAWAAAWRETDRTFAPLDARLVDRAVAELAETAAPRVLDIGCGAGSTTLAVAQARPDADVTGVDLSAALVAVAAARAASEPRVRFVAADATRFAVDRRFDLLVSRHGVMFFDDPVAAFAHLRGLAAPGAALVFTCFRERALNLWADRPVALLPDAPPPPGDGPGPFAFADAARVAGLLAAAGWRQAAVEPVDYDYVAAEGADPVAAALAFLLRIGPVAAAVRALDEAARASFLDRLAALLAQYRAGDRIVFPAAAWLWRARA